MCRRDNWWAGGMTRALGIQDCMPALWIAWRVLMSTGGIQQLLQIIGSILVSFVCSALLGHCYRCRGRCNLEVAVQVTLQTYFLLLNICLWRHTRSSATWCSDSRAAYCHHMQPWCSYMCDISNNYTLGMFVRSCTCVLLHLRVLQAISHFCNCKVASHMVCVLSCRPPPRM